MDTTDTIAASTDDISLPVAGELISLDEEWVPSPKPDLSKRIFTGKFCRMNEINMHSTTAVGAECAGNETWSEYKALVCFH